MNQSKSSFIKSLKKNWRYIGKNKFQLILFLILVSIMTLTIVIFPALSSKIILAATDNLLNQVIILGLISFLCGIIYTVTGNLSNKFEQALYIKIVQGIQEEASVETLKLETKEIDKNGTGIFIERLNNDTNTLAEVFLIIISDLIPLITKIGLVVSIFFINKYMFIYCLINVTTIYIIDRYRMKKVYEVSKELKEQTEIKTSLTSEIVRGFRDIRVLNIENTILNKMKNIIHACNKKSYDLRNIRRKYNLIEGIVSEMFQFGFIIFGIYLCSINKLEIANFILLFMYGSNIETALTKLPVILEEIKKFDLSTERVYEVIENNTYAKEKFGTEKLPKAHGDFEFQNVTFSYDGTHNVIDNMSFKVRANETVSFVGKSGAGKTTIFNLLNKAYPIKEGKILIDGKDINTLDKDSIRNNMSIITQNPYIFNMSIKENLAIVKPDLADEEMIKVCQIACLDDFIQSLPDKYDTIVGENGIMLSGGQKQRLAIARALLKKTEIILFDEATSALDNDTQSEIQKAINNMKGEYTILIIAHRLSTVIDSDRIILIDDGHVVDSGTHYELLQKNEFYQHLYQKELEEN